MTHSSADTQRIDWSKVESYLRSTIPDLPDRKMKVKKFSEGYSNLTYLLQFGDWEGVLRRPPFGYVPPKAHDMSREYRVLSKVHPVFPYAPEPYLYCEDPAIMDKHFYVMEKKEGIVVDGELPPEYEDNKETSALLSENVIGTLAELQSIDYQQGGLAELGKPQGYLERQVHGWIKRYEQAKTEENKTVNTVEKWLIENLPASSETTIVHNDFKLNNMVLDAENPSKTTGVLDWELSTIGDPLTDLGSTVAYWGQSDDPDMGINIVTNKPGFYSRREFLESYAKKSNRDLSHINYYVTFGFYKLAVILQQIYYRWKIGEIDDSRFKELNQNVANLIHMAQQTKENRVL